MFYKLHQSFILKRVFHDIGIGYRNNAHSLKNWHSLCSLLGKFCNPAIQYRTTFTILLSFSRFHSSVFSYCSTKTCKKCKKNVHSQSLVKSASKGWEGGREVTLKLNKTKIQYFWVSIWSLVWSPFNKVSLVAYPVGSCKGTKCFFYSALSAGLWVILRVRSWTAVTLLSRQWQSLALLSKSPSTMFLAITYGRAECQEWSPKQDQSSLHTTPAHTNCH